MKEAASAAGLLLKLYELRTEPTLRQARAWFSFEFHPDTAKDVLRTWLGPGHESAPYRMVTTYWDMAATFVTQGAITPEMFNAANTEHFARYLEHQRALAAAGKQRSYLDQQVSVRAG